MNIKYIYYLHEIGEKKNQEDYIWPPPDTATGSDRIFIVCDGVGGAENGELASKTIAASVGKALSQTDFHALDNDTINKILSQARQQLSEYVRENGLNPDMATTFTVLVLNEEKAFVAWCGDSRVYHIRAGKILYRTADHSLVHTLVKSGEITESEASVHPQKNIILKAIRADNAPIEAETHLIENVQNGDFFLLCTDGLLENINNEKLLSIISGNTNDIIKSFQQYCKGKTRDNYSMYLLKTGGIKTSLNKLTNKLAIAVIVLIILLAGAAFAYNSLWNKKENFQREILPVKTTAPASNPVIEITDSQPPVVYYEIEHTKNENDSADLNEKEQKTVGADIITKSKRAPQIPDSIKTRITNIPGNTLIDSTVISDKN